jgi:NAD(P)-dependent dehydrogenase (short-subunit alcohol dehydrogenase family)
VTRVAIVTGAGRGLGRVVALALVADGWTTIVTGRDQAMLDAVVAEAGPLADAVVCDVTSADDVRRLFDTAVERHGRVDLVFNNAGVAARGVPIDELDVSEWQRVVETNLTGTFLSIQQAFRVMKAQVPQGGRIINNGSISATTPRPNSSPYTSTKHGVTGLTKSASLDGRAFNIACGQIDIGNAATDLTAPMRSGDGVPQANGERLVEPTIDPQHVADAVLYIANLPLAANVQTMTVMATTMPFVGRG